MWDDRRGGVLVRHARIADLANDVASDDWLTVLERRELERYRDVGRRTAWLCGRLLGKRLILEAFSRTALQFRDPPASWPDGERSDPPCDPQTRRLAPEGAEDGSPRREPWEMSASGNRQPRKGRQNRLRTAGALSPLPRLADQAGTGIPTAHAVGYLLPPLPRLHQLAVEILSRDERGRAVRPTARVRGAALDLSLSISHTDRLVIAALARGGCSVGVDVVSIRDVNPAALRLWFTAREAELLRLGDSCETARAWAIKEAAYKALNDGEPFAPQRIEIVRTSAGENEILYDGIELRVDYRVETWEIGDHIAALVTSSDLRRFAATRQAVDQRLAESIPT